MFIVLLISRDVVRAVKILSGQIQGGRSQQVNKDL